MTPTQHPYFIVDTANPKLDCLAIVSRSLLLLGYPEQGLKRSQEAVAVARGLSYPFGLAIALGEAALFHLHCRDGQGAREWAEAVMTLATEQGFPHWVACGTLVRGWVLAEQGQVLEGIAQMRQSQVSFSAPHVLPEAYGKAGQVEKGLAMLAKALAFVDKTGTRAHEAELHRVKGELILQSSVQCPASRAKQAEACFLKAIDIARRQSAKLLELRAVMCLSRLWQQQGKRQEARNLLAETYGWFTEGFDTKDLQEAKALLEELT